MKRFFKAFNKENDCFKYLRESFPGASEEKLKDDIFDWPQIRKMKNNKEFTFCSVAWTDSLITWVA